MSPSGKIFALGPCVGLDPQRQNFALGIPPCWYLKTRKSPTRYLKFVLPPMPNPNASQRNIGCVGSQTQISRIGHVHSMFFCVDFICVGYPTQTRFQWNMDLRRHVLCQMKETVMLPWQFGRLYPSASCVLYTIMLLGVSKGKNP